MKNFNIVILAAGKGSRMLSAQPKVLHSLGGYPILSHVVRTAFSLNPDLIAIVHSQAEEQLKSAALQFDCLNAQDPENLKNKIVWVSQDQPKGTGHALQQAVPHLGKAARTLVLFGDTPLIEAETILRALLKETPEEALGLITAFPDDPSHLGRVVRDDQTGDILRIVEHREATDLQQAQWKEIFSGLMVIPHRFMSEWLSAIRSNNSQNEYYLTDIVALARNNGVPVVGTVAPHPLSVSGINTRQDLAEMERFYQVTAAQRLLSEGVSLADPGRFDLRGVVQAGQDVFLDVNTVLEGRVVLGHHVHIGAGCYLRNVRIGDHVKIRPYSVIDGAEIDSYSVIGPFAHLRPGTRLGEKAKIGNFVEVKNSTIGADSKASHLSYLGDATVGRGTNIGAGTITCNYDGQVKHSTSIGDQVLIGAGSQLVAPISIGDGALVGAGSVLTRNVPAHKLTLSRTPQKTVALPYSHASKQQALKPKAKEALQADTASGIDDSDLQSGD